MNPAHMSSALADSLLLCFKRVSCEWMVLSNASGKSLRWPPSVDSWRRTGKNQERAIIKKKKVYSGRYTLHRSIDRVWAILEGKRQERESTGLTVLIGLGNL